VVWESETTIAFGATTEFNVETTHTMGDLPMAADIVNGIANKSPPRRSRWRTADVGRWAVTEHLARCRPP
jgi:hypothetical protein